jgi:hypothetical protein
MFTYPYIANQLATERQREMLPQAHQHRIIRQLRDLAGARRRAERPDRRVTRALKRTRPAARPLMNHTAAASSHPKWGDPSWPL